MIFNYLEPADMAYISEEKKFLPYELGSHISILEDEMYDFTSYQLAIIGVKEGRLAGMKNLGCDLAPEEIRKQLFRLTVSDSSLKIIDVGNLKEHETPEDTHQALESVLAYMHKQGLTVIILGGSQDLTVPQYKSLSSFNDKISLTIVDERIDLKGEKETIMSDSFLQPILLSKDPELFHLAVLGYQTYFTHSKTLDLIKGMNHDAVRLGLMRYSLSNYDYLFQNSNAVSIDISCIKQSDAPARSMQTPNGFQADELCQITRMAGQSSKVNSLGIYEINPHFDLRNQTVQLVAQSIWYFIEGYSQRIEESPENNNEVDNFKTYIVEMIDFEHLSFTFWNSKLSNSWWVELPLVNSNQSNIFPCSKLDYLKCSNGEMSDWVFNLLSKLS